MLHDSGSSFGELMLPAKRVCLETCELFLHVCFFIPPSSCSSLDPTVCVFYFFMSHWLQSSGGNFALKKKVHKAHKGLAGAEPRDSLIKSHPRVKACRHRLPSHPSPDSSSTRGTGLPRNTSRLALKQQRLTGGTF